jgi:hypothetical protein
LRVDLTGIRLLCASTERWKPYLYWARTAQPLNFFVTEKKRPAIAAGLDP